MATYTLISSNVLTTTAASVTFSSIPATFTDLVVRVSARCSVGAARTGLNLTLNGSSVAVYSYTILYASGASASSYNGGSSTSLAEFIGANGATSTTNTFANDEIYIPNYASSAYKVLSGVTAQEINSTGNNLNQVAAGLWSNTAAITSITLVDNNASNFVSGSSFYLYGISNA